MILSKRERQIMAYPSNSWAILPATDALFGKTKVRLEAAMLEMGRYGGEGTMLICERENGDGKKTRFMLSSAGRMELADGFTRKAHHDQNLRPYGYVKVLASVFYTVAMGDDGKNQVVTTLPQGVNFDMNLPLFVFK
jgi:hypothetical protein